MLSFSFNKMCKHNKILIKKSVKLPSMDLHNFEIVFWRFIVSLHGGCITIFISQHFSWRCLERHTLHFTFKTFYHIKVFMIRELLLIKTREGILNFFWYRFRQKLSKTLCWFETSISTWKYIVSWTKIYACMIL